MIKTLKSLITVDQALSIKNTIFDKKLLVMNEYEKNFGRYYSRRNDEASLISNKLVFDKIQSNFERKIYFSYGFVMYYTKSVPEEAGYLSPHLDNIDNEITVSLSIDKSAVSKHPLMVSKRVFANPYPHRITFKNYTEDYETVDLEIGDGGMFNGRNRVHWRSDEKTETPFVNILLHYMYEPYNEKDVNELLAKNPVLNFENVDQAIEKNLIS
jgi:hypothetical protein